MACVTDNAALAMGQIRFFHARRKQVQSGAGRPRPGPRRLLSLSLAQLGPWCTALGWGTARQSMEGSMAASYSSLIASPVVGLLDTDRAAPTRPWRCLRPHKSPSTRQIHVRHSAWLVPSLRARSRRSHLRSQVRGAESRKEAQGRVSGWRRARTLPVN